MVSNNLFPNNALVRWERLCADLKCSSRTKQKSKLGIYREYDKGSHDYNATKRKAMRLRLLLTLLTQDLLDIESQAALRLIYLDRLV
jgi:hypothetical protein